VIDVVPDPPRQGEPRENLPTVDPLHISRMAEARDLKFCVLTEGCVSDKNYAKVSHRGRGKGRIAYF